MPNFTVNTIQDTYQRSVVQFLWGGGSAVTPYNLTGSVAANSLTGWNSSYGITSQEVDLGISKLYWSMPVGSTSQSLEMSWGISGSVTGSPAMYLNGNGFVNFSDSGIKLTHPDVSANRRNTIQFRNVGALAANDTISVIVEIDKNFGYSK